MSNKAVLYIRVSTDEQSKTGVSLDAQEEKLLTYCKLMDLEPVKVIREEGVSAFKPLASRPGGRELTNMINKKQVQHVVVLKLDRLFRNAEDALNRTKIWEKAGISLHLVDMGGQTINTATAMGKMFITIMAGFAELERNLTSERTKMALTHKKDNRRAYGHAPYGYRLEEDNLVEVPEELAVIQQIFRWYDQGWRHQRIASELNRLNVPTKNGGKKWYPSTLKAILNNRQFYGVQEVVGIAG
ncbi:integrase [Desulfocucumis palustris]|uniref:Integrase n=1 Tax=Desulfocucumis palustris TaxID=1898651 RepID=A0A2L2XBB4_9FIRM|nr:recombinase family protein [Desulfocucumis palustris]GBF33362.1 integrase [Desulfocucumis palustris]